MEAIWIFFLDQIFSLTPEGPRSRPPEPQMGRFSGENTSSKEYWIGTEKEAANPA